VYWLKRSAKRALALKKEIFFGLFGHSFRYLSSTLNTQNQQLWQQETNKAKASPIAGRKGRRDSANLLLITAATHSLRGRCNGQPQEDRHSTVWRKGTKALANGKAVPETVIIERKNSEATSGAGFKIAGFFYALPARFHFLFSSSIAFCIIVEHPAQLGSEKACSRLYPFGYEFRFTDGHEVILSRCSPDRNRL